MVLHARLLMSRIRAPITVRVVVEMGMVLYPRLRMKRVDTPTTTFGVSVIGMALHSQLMIKKVGATDIRGEVTVRLSRLAAMTRSLSTKSYRRFFGGEYRRG